MKLWKILNDNGSCCHGGNGKWNLPKGKRPGKWMPVIKGDIKPCRNGYHLCRSKDLLGWLNATIYEAEAGSERVAETNKVVVRKARLLRKVDNWNEKTARMFACDCAARVLHFYERKYDDPRVRNCIEVARLYANGKATHDDLAAARAAARAAAWAAARAAAWAAAWDAEGRWQSKRLALYLRYGDRVKPWPLPSKPEGMK
jgi:hypothetical protein